MPRPKKVRTDNVREDKASVPNEPTEAKFDMPFETLQDDPVEDAPAEQPADVHVGPPSELAVEMAAELPADRPVDPPAEQPADRPFDPPAEPPAEVPASTPVKSIYRSFRGAAGWKIILDTGEEIAFPREMTREAILQKLNL